MKHSLVCVTLLSLAAPLAAQLPHVLVPMVADETYGPCSTAYVYGLERAGDFLAVRTGPSTRYRELARLANGRTSSLATRMSPASTNGRSARPSGWSMPAWLRTPGSAPAGRPASPRSGRLRPDQGAERRAAPSRRGDVEDWLGFPRQLAGAGDN